MHKVSSAFRNLFLFYYDGFSSMSALGKRIWIIILIKLFIIFIVLKLFFFPDLLKTGFRSDSERSTFVRNQILNINN
ncbi:MAG: DUF4492 domain-containing protein [Bacteroidales bacterium]